MIPPELRGLLSTPYLPQSSIEVLRYVYHRNGEPTSIDEITQHFKMNRYDMNLIIIGLVNAGLLDTLYYWNEQDTEVLLTDQGTIKLADLRSLSIAHSENQLNSSTLIFDDEPDKSSCVNNNNDLKNHQPISQSVDTQKAVITGVTIKESESIRQYHLPQSVFEFILFVLLKINNKTGKFILLIVAIIFLLFFSLLELFKTLPEGPKTRIFCDYFPNLCKVEPQPVNGDTQVR